MKPSLFIFAFFVCQTGFAQLTTMRSCGPSAHYESSFNHFKDTIVYYGNGNKHYQFEILDSTHGVYTDYKEKSGKLITRLEYRIEKDTFFFQRVEIWKKSYLKSAAVYNDSATSYSVVYYFDKSKDVWLKFNRDVFVHGQNHSGYTGLYQEFYKNGKLRMEGTYEKGCRIGIWKNYHDNGQLESMGNYTASFTKLSCPMGDINKIHYTFWNSRTNDTTVIISKGVSLNDDAELVKKYEMERDGLTQCSGHYYYHRHGEWKYWDRNGKLIGKKKWKYGELKKQKKYR